MSDGPGDEPAGRRLRFGRPGGADGGERAPDDEPRSHRPAHHPSGRRRPVVAEAPDRRTLVVRALAVAAVAAAVAGALVLDGNGDTGADEATRLAAARTGAAAMPAVPPAATGSSTWYCAAGTAVPEGTADHTVVMANPGDTPVTATLEVVAGDVRRPGAPASAVPDPVAVPVELPARGRIEVRLGDVVEAPLAAAVVEVAGPGVAVEHRIAGPHGADVGPCANFAAPTWHFAWGATTRDARELVVLFNPFPSPATVDATFTTEDGPREPLRLQGFPVPARSVVGLDLGDDVTRSEQVSATFSARSGRVVVERVEQFDGTFDYQGLTLGLGAPEAAATWVFADGAASAPAPAPPSDDDEDPAPTTTTTTAARGTTTTTAAGDEDDDEGPASSERIVVYNPGDERARVAVELRPTPVPGEDADAPLPPPFRLTVGPGGYEVVDYGDQPRVAAGQAHATVVRSTNGVPVVAERVTVDTGERTRAGRPGEITAAPGARYAAERWTFPSLILAEGDATTFAVYNPDPDRTVRVEVEALAGAPGATGATVVQVPPGGRVGVPLDADLTAAAGVVVRARAPVVVDRTVQREDGLRQAAGAGLPALELASLL